MDALSSAKANGILSQERTPLTRLRRISIPRLGLIALLLALGAAILLRFPPAQYAFYPQCPIHHYLGLLCPGCGTTRALAALLRGHLIEALRLNALTTLGLPLASVWAIFSRGPQGLSRPSPIALCTVFAIVAAFTLIRNL